MFRSSALLCIPFCVGCSETQAPPITEIEINETVDPAVVDLITQRIAKVRERPLDAQARAELAMVYEANAFWDAAQGSWGAALTLAEGRSEWLHHRAICLREAGQTQAALQSLQEAVAADPTNLAARNDLGVTWLQEGDSEKARHEFEVALAAAPEHPVLLEGMAEVCLSEKDAQQAAALCERALEGAPDYKRAHYTLGLAYRDLGRSEEARAEMSRGLDAKRLGITDPVSKRIAELKTSYTARINEANNLQKRGENEKAAHLLELILESRPTDVTAANNLAAIYNSMKRFVDAERLARIAQRSDPQQFASYINLSTALLEQGKVAEALEQAERAVALAPQVGRCYFIRARALLAANRAEEAYRELLRAVDLDATQVEAFATLGQVAMGQKDYQGAAKHFRDALRLQPDFFAAQARLTFCLIRLGRRPEAMAALERAKALAPNHPDIATLSRELGLR